MIFLFTFVTFNQQTAGLEKKSDSLEWPAWKDERVEGPNISVSWTGTKLGPNMYFVNKQLTDITKKLSSPWFFKQFSIVWVKQTFSEILSKIERITLEKIEIKR